MATKFTDRLALEAEQPKTTTADLNRFSKAFVASLEKNNVPDATIKACVSEFTEQLPGFINREGPHTVEAVQQRLASVQATINDKLDRENSPEAKQMKPMVEAAFQAGNEAFSKRPEAAKGGELTLEAVTLFTQVLGKRIRATLPHVENPESGAIDRLGRAFPEMVSRTANLPETVEQMQATVNEAKGNVIARTQGRFKTSEDKSTQLSQAFADANRSLLFTSSQRRGMGGLV